MNLKIFLTIIIGIILTLGSILFIDITAGGIVLILMGTILMVQMISADAAKNLHPEIFASLSDDSRFVIIENPGTAPAQAVEMRVIPDDHHIIIGDIQMDETRKIALPTMLHEGKAIISWVKKEGVRTEKVFRLSGYERESDPLRPVFPLFSWKGKE